MAGALRMPCSNSREVYCFYIICIRTQATWGKGSVFLFLVLALAECLIHDNTKEISVQWRDQYDNFCEKKKLGCYGCQKENILNFGQDKAGAEQAFLEGVTLKSILEE